MLELEGLSAAYGKSPVLWDVDLRVGDGEAVALIGRNGVGKTTLLRTVAGLHPLSGGRVRLAGRDLSRTPAFERARRGLSIVPQGRGIFPHLSVTENLLMGLPALSGRAGPAPAGLPAEVFELFPALHDLRDRKGGNLSGGQQQQLAIGRSLVTRPRLLLLDEPTEGIQPSVVHEIEAALARVRRDLGVAVLLVEQYLEFAWSFADRFYVMQKGRVVDSGATNERPSSSVGRFMGV